ncbi:MAG: amino acid ABC transporter ATP-binding protein [Clostridiales bacterium]|jgi:polar amino acid transport system ATP-binding protein|nr:amino acid ABC transporter ATP-binding protein [Clostridiales bacterium]
MDVNLLEVEQLRKSYKDAEVLKGLSFTLARGDVLVVAGPSGCGKSTLLRCINGLEPFQSGVIRLSGRDLTAPGVKWTEVRQKVGMVFQSYELFPHMNVLDNLLLAPRKAQGLSKSEASARAASLLERVGLKDKMKSFPRELSGGQKQRVAILRALMMKPELMLFDEVTAALDPEMVREVLDLMLELATDGMTMIIVTHEMQFAQAAASRVLFMDEGEIVETSSPDVFFTFPKTDRAKQFLNIFHFEKKERRH